jgi:hypothetical protein
MGKIVQQPSLIVYKISFESCRILFVLLKFCFVILFIDFEKTISQESNVLLPALTNNKFSNLKFLNWKKRNQIFTFSQTKKKFFFNFNFFAKKLDSNFIQFQKIPLKQTEHKLFLSQKRSFFRMHTCYIV